MSLKLRGIIVPHATPFGSDGAVNESVLRELVDYLIESGVHGLIPCGSTGEYVYLTEQEHKKVVETVVDQVNNRVPVIAGAGNPNTDKAVSLAKYAKDVGADAVMVIVPYYHTPTADGIVQHYETIGTKAEIPILMYNFPRVTGIDIDPKTVLTLAESGSLIGLKDSSRDFGHYAEALHTVGDKISVLNGQNDFILPALAIGGHGAVVTSSNIVPGVLVDLFNAFQAGNTSRATELYRKLLPLWKIVHSESNPIIVKEGLTLLGKPVGPPRKPLHPAKKENSAKLREVLINLEVLH